MTVTSPTMVVPNNCTIMSIRNHHRQPAPDLRKLFSPDCYVSYFQNAQQNQWIFVRPDGAERGSLYGSSLKWHSHEVYEGAGDQDLVDADLDLDEHERAWLRTAWQTSEARRG